MDYPGQTPPLLVLTVSPRPFLSTFIRSLLPIPHPLLPLLCCIHPKWGCSSRVCSFYCQTNVKDSGVTERCLSVLQRLGRENLSDISKWGKIHNYMMEEENEAIFQRLMLVRTI